MRKCSLLQASLVVGALLVLVPGRAQAGFFNWDIRYNTGGSLTPARGLSLVFYGKPSELRFISVPTVNGGAYWPNGEGSQVSAPTFAVRSESLSVEFPPSPGFSGNTDVYWDVANGDILPGQGVHVGAYSGKTAKLRGAFFRNAAGALITGTGFTVLQLEATYSVGSPPPPGAFAATVAATTLPGTLPHGQTASVTIPGGVPAGSRVILFHKSTDLGGNFIAAQISETDPAPGAPGTFATAVIEVSNDAVNPDGTPGPMLILKQAGFKIVPSEIPLADLNPGNPAVTTQMTQLQIATGTPASSGVYSAALAAALAALGFAVVKRRRWMTA